MLKDFKGDFTVLSSVSHPGGDGGHANEKSFLTAVPYPAGGGFRNTVSLDQYAADCVAAQAHFRSLVLEVTGGGGGRMSYTSSGVLISSEGSPAAVYRQLFVAGDEAEVAARLEVLRDRPKPARLRRRGAARLGRNLGAATATGSTGITPRSASWRGSSGGRRCGSASPCRSRPPRCRKRSRRPPG